MVHFRPEEVDKPLVKAEVVQGIIPGDVAQLEERNNRTVEVRGSSPLISTHRRLAYHSLLW